jgi:hypothetical protein
VTNLVEKEGEKGRSVKNKSVAHRLKIPILISWTYDPNVITQRKPQEETEGLMLTILYLTSFYN